MSGVEALGYILATLPLLISAAEHYREGLQPFKEWKRYHLEVEAFSRDLEGQRCLFRNTCEALLRAILSEEMGAETLEALLAGEAWKDARFERKLAETLRDSYTSYIHCVDDIVNIVKELEKQDSQSKQMSSSTFGKLSKRHAKQELEKIKFAWSKSTRSELLESLKSKNYLLSQLTQGTIPLAKLRQDTEPTHSTMLRHVRVYACSLYTALESGWCCNCRTRHSANMRLETRDGSDVKMTHGELQGISEIRFRILFSSGIPPDIHPGLQWTYEAADIMPLTSAIKPDQSLPKAQPKRVAFVADPPNPPPAMATEKSSNAAQIPSLCRLLEEISKRVTTNNDCLGFLLDQDGKPHCLYRVCNTHTQATEVSRSLSEILTPKEAGKSDGRQNVELFLKDRLQVGLKLACTVLQLHPTPWLDERWSSENILMLREPQDATKEALLEPYIAKAFAPDASSDAQLQSRSLGHAGRRICIRNESLFALGLVLLELAYNKPLKEFWQPDDLGEDGNPNAFTDISVAVRLESTLEREVGPVYAAVVRRCLHCTFDVDDVSLENDKFHRVVYLGVVKPLMDILKLWGKTY